MCVCVCVCVVSVCGVCVCGVCVCVCVCVCVSNLPLLTQRDVHSIAIATGFSSLISKPLVGARS